MKAKILALPPSAFRYPRAIRFQDIDAAGIVFFARIFEYFHDAYVAFLDGTDAALPESVASGVWAAPLVHAEADFLAPLSFGDTIEVELAGVALDKKRMTIAYRVHRGEIVATVGHTMHVFVDRQTFKSTPIPDAPRRVMERLTNFEVD